MAESATWRAAYARLSTGSIIPPTQSHSSINDTPGARDVFGRFEFDEAEVTYTFANKMTGAGKRVGELILRGGQAT